MDGAEYLAAKTTQSSQRTTDVIVDIFEPRLMERLQVQIRLMSHRQQQSQTA